MQEPKQRVVFTLDEVNFPGGGHLATFQQMEFLQRAMGLALVVLCLDTPSQALRMRFPKVRFVFPAPHWRRQGRVKRLLREVRSPDIVCVPFENSFFRPAVASLTCRKKIQWVHIDYAYWRSMNPRLTQEAAQDEALYAAFDQIVFVSQKGRQGFVALYPHLAERCAVCQNFFNPEDIRQKAALPMAAGQARFSALPGLLKMVTVARLDNQQKGIARCLLVAELLKSKGYAFQWIFLGSGKPQEVQLFHQMTTDLALSDCILWAGLQENPFPTVAMADVSVLFSFYEGLPNTVYESMLVGTPVIATRVSGVEEQILPGLGWVVDNTPEAMYDGLAGLLEQPDQLAKARTALQGYTYDLASVQTKVKRIFMSEKPMGEPPMEREPAVSVVVPVYNVQAYLAQCLQSLVEQTLDDIEILVVNDGSPDASCEVIDSFVQLFPQKVRRLDKPNGGLGDARNYGISQAQGRYLAFIDGDDWAAPLMLEVMYAAGVRENCDIVLTDLYGCDDMAKTQVEEHAPFEEGKLEPSALMRNCTRPVVVSACTKLYRRTLFQQHSFPDGWYEDMGLIPILYSYAQGVYYLRRCLYHYRWNREGSIQSQKNSPKTLDIFKAKQRVLQGCNPEYLPEAAYAVYEHCVHFYDQYPVFTQETLRFLEKNRCYFENNPWIQADWEGGLLPNLLSGPPLIPQNLFYFADNSTIFPQKSGLSDTWCQLQPEGKAQAITLPAGNEPGQREFVLFQKLFREGGVFLDTDMEIRKPLQPLLFYGVLMSFQTHLTISSSVLAAQPNHPLMAKITEFYKQVLLGNRTYLSPQKALADALTNAYGLRLTGRFQILPDRIAVLPPNFLLVDLADGLCYLRKTDSAGEQEGTVEFDKTTVLQDYFLYPALRAYALHTPARHEGGDTTEPSGSPYEVTDAILQRYGLALVLRQSIKAFLKKIVPRAVFRKLEGWALEK